MDIERQVEIMEAQISNFETVIDKMSYLNLYFKPDPEFTEEARKKVISNLCKTLKHRR